MTDKSPSTTESRPILPVSLILIVKDGERFIGEALTSVLQGTAWPNEILVIDGDSQDRTVEIARSFDRVRVLSQPNKGIPNAYNFGIKAAKHDLIAFISHDDVWAPTKLALQFRVMSEDPSLDYCVGRAEHFVERGQQPPKNMRPEFLDGPVVAYIMETLMVRKSLFDRIGLFDPSLAVGEDTDWFARARDAQVEHRCLDDVLVRKRVHGSNSSMTHRNVNQFLLRTLRKSVDRKRSATAQGPGEKTSAAPE